MSTIHQASHGLGMQSSNVSSIRAPASPHTFRETSDEHMKHTIRNLRVDLHKIPAVVFEKFMINMNQLRGLKGIFYTLKLNKEVMGAG